MNSAKLGEIAVRHQVVLGQRIDPRAEHDFDEAVDMAAGPVDLERHDPTFFEPAAEHPIMLALIGTVLLDHGEQRLVAGVAAANGIDHPVERRITPVLVVDVDRGDDLKVAALEPFSHF